MADKKYDIVIGSPVDYEKLVAEIRMDGKYLALLSQEEGTEKMKVEFLEHHNIETVDYDTLLSALKDAKEELSRG